MQNLKVNKHDADEKGEGQESGLKFLFRKYYFTLSLES